LNHHLSKPIYDTTEDQVRQQRIREADYILEAAVPDLPDRETELEYMQWLQDDIRADPWVGQHFKKLMAGPKRVPYKNNTELSKQYRVQYMFYFATGALICWPLAMWVGNKAQTSRGGVPVYPM